MRSCENCIFNYCFIKDRNTGEVLETNPNADVCQNPRSNMYGQDCRTVKICGKWVKRNETN